MEEETEILPQTCIVPTCESTAHRGFFKFPVEDEELMILWNEKMPFLQSLQINFYETFICEDHFAEDQVFKKGTKEKKLLRVGAVPTIFDGSKVTPPKTKAARKQVKIEEEEEDNDDEEEGGEEIQEEAERSNCRFCMKPINFGNEIDITESVKRYFREVTSTDFVDHLGYSDVCCKHCYSDLKKSMSVRKRFIKNQEKLLNLLGVPESGENEKDFDEQKPPQLVRIKQEYPQQMDVAYADYSTPDFSYQDQDQDHSGDQDSSPDIKMFIPEIRHSNERRKDFECDYCGKKFGKRRLGDHVKIHIKLKDIPCEFCDMLFTSKGSLYVHKKNHHFFKSLIYCELCGDRFNNKDLYNTHIRAKHTGEKPFVCDDAECGKAFHSKVSLYCHKTQVHREMKPCEICNKVTKDLKSHMKSHIGYQFICNFVCEDGSVCGKKFITNSRLKQHEDVHVGIKRFICKFCGAAYSGSGSLNNHIRGFHMNFRMKCGLPGCTSEFARKKNLRSHVMSVHKYIGEEQVQAALDRIRAIPMPAIDL